MSIHIFTGPTLDKESILSKIPEAIVHPPIARDDLFKIPFSAGDHVLIIDGYFETQPAVAHFEIIDLIEKGVIVFGASSMGALRASELKDIGMIGIGLIFELYSSGKIDGDDEVSMLHSADFIPLSVPLIDLRINLEKLVDNKKIAPQIFEQIISQLSQYAYQERTLTLVKKIISENAGPHEQELILEMLKPEHSQKRADALLALDAIQKPMAPFTLSLPKTAFRMRAKKRVESAKH